MGIYCVKPLVGIKSPPYHHTTMGEIIWHSCYVSSITTNLVTTPYPHIISRHLPQSILLHVFFNFIKILYRVVCCMADIFWSRFTFTINYPLYNPSQNPSRVSWIEIFLDSLFYDEFYHISYHLYQSDSMVPPPPYHQSHPSPWYKHH